MASNQFIPSPPMPPCSHYEQQPGVIVPPSSNATIPGQNPAPSNSPCQDCAIHHTILQSMAFSMQSMDYTTCQHLHASASCPSCYYTYQLQQQRAAMGQGQHFHHVCQPQCGHVGQSYAPYDEGNDTQYPPNAAPHQSLSYQNWSQSGPSNNAQNFLPPPPEVTHCSKPSTPYTSHTPASILSLPSPTTTPTIPNSVQSYDLPAQSDITPRRNNNIGSTEIRSQEGISLNQAEHLSVFDQESRTLQNSGLDPLSGLSSMKIDDANIKQETNDEKSENPKKKIQKTPSDKRRSRDSEKRGSEGRKRQPDDVCQVCGDKASGYHYNALTCEGCKGFFRRSITNRTTYKQGCKHGGTCEMDTYTRRKCPFCRLKKCKEVGMLEECLLTEIQCQSKRKRRNQKHQQAEELKLDETSQDTSVTSPGQSSIASSPSSSDSSQSGEGAVSLTLTDEETKLIETVGEAFSKYNISEDVVRRWEKYINNESNTSCRLSDITTVHVQVLVEFAKNIPGFLALDPEDQIALLKGSVFEAMLLRNSCGYHHLRRAINKSAILDELGIEANKLDALIEFFNCIGKLDMDKIEYALLIATVIFNSDYPFVKNKVIVEEYQDLYLNALAKYSLTREPLRPSIFAKILAMLTEIRSLSHYNAEVVTSWKRRGALTPLLCEIWDLD